MNQEHQKRGYLLDDFRLFHLNEVQTKKVEFHYHEFYKVFMLRSGNGSYSVAGDCYMLEEGDVVLIGSRQVHRPEFDMGVAYERVILYISPEFLSRFSTEECNLEAIFSGEYGYMLRTTKAQRQRLRALTDSLERELSGRDYGCVVMSNGVLLQLLVEIGRGIQNKEMEETQPVTTDHKGVLEILHYLDAHFTEEIGIDDLAEKFYVSKYHMMRLFRKEVGQSIHSYLTERRLLYAKELISQGVSATESCFRAGFHSYSSFTRAYGKRFSTTPTGRTDCAVKREETYE